MGSRFKPWQPLLKVNLWASYLMNSQRANGLRKPPQREASETDEWGLQNKLLRKEDNYL